MSTKNKGGRPKIGDKQITATVQTHILEYLEAIAKKNRTNIQTEVRKILQYHFDNNSGGVHSIPKSSELCLPVEAVDVKNDTLIVSFPDTVREIFGIKIPLHTIFLGGNK